MVSYSNFTPDDLRSLAERIFTGVGLSDEHARIYADHLIFSDLRGIPSHGVTRIPIYAERLRRGVVNARPEIRNTREAASVMRVDGDNGPGAVVGTVAMNHALTLAKESGVGVAVARHSNHYGACAYFTMMALPKDCIALSSTSSGLMMAVWGGRETALGTNPFSVAVPAGRHRPIVVDMATSVVARGKIVEMGKRGESIPEGWALDSEGRPTTDGRAAIDGVVLPFSGPKGSAIAIVVDILSGVLSGAGFGPFINALYSDFTNPQNVGHFFLAMDIARFMPVAEFKDRMDLMIDKLKASAKAPGFDEILMPGEPEFRNEARLTESGIPVPTNIVEEIAATAAAVGVPMPEAKN